MADIEKISTQQLDTPFKSDEYKELLLQAVAVIESARFRLARQVAATSNDTYWEIGKFCSRCSSLLCSLGSSS